MTFFIFKFLRNKLPYGIVMEKYRDLYLETLKQFNF
jgi:hypothetical protein